MNIQTESNEQEQQDIRLQGGRRCGINEALSEAAAKTALYLTLGRDLQEEEEYYGRVDLPAQYRGCLRRLGKKLTNSTRPLRIGALIGVFCRFRVKAASSSGENTVGSKSRNVVKKKQV